MKNEIADIAELICGYRKAKVLFVAAALDLFRHTCGRGRTASAIGKRLRADLRSTTILLDALASMGFLCKKLGRYSNSRTADAFLVPGRPGYLGNNLVYQDIIWDAWGKLGEVVRTGSTSFPLMDLISDRKDFLDGYIKGMADIAKRPAAQIAEKISFRGRGRMLDVGGGPGTYTEAFLQRSKELRGDILDLPETLRLTKKMSGSHRLSGRISFVEGDYHKTDFGDSVYDIVLFSNVTHDEGPAENQALLRKAWRALRPGGQVIIHDFMLNRDRTAPLFSALFSVHMLVYTNKGRVYSVDEYSAWLKKAGFRRLRSWAICPEADNTSRALVGRK